MYGAIAGAKAVEFIQAEEIECVPYDQMTSALRVTIKFSIAAKSIQPTSKALEHWKTQTETHVEQPFRLLDLPRKIRVQIYAKVMLPSDNLIHPFFKPWHDQTTVNVVPLLTTCRKIWREAEMVLYSWPIFHAPLELKFLRSLNNRQLGMVRFVRLDLRCGYTIEYGYLFENDFAIFELMRLK